MIIFLNGASSSGKTSLARALQDSWGDPLLCWSLRLLWWLLLLLLLLRASPCLSHPLQASAS